ncbi:class I SAM-dependent methyltransferase [Paenibacillus sanguinis]|uniref:class I SAM-dependent methyltransferase n=1 Tax=Paenibacillus sanguinis TaxID=225906 RepID=UPI000369104B|nr:class I SAM-dependent methyltransferase [Paenibacillus sanguinis]
MKVSVTELVDVVNQQFQQSSFKNLFCTVKNQIHFNTNTIKALRLLHEQSVEFTNEELDVLLQKIINRFITTFYQTDPYINFNNGDTLIIRQIYLLTLRDTAKLPIEEIEKRHYERIRWFIRKTNPVIYQINCNSNSYAKHFISTEYSSAFQMKLLSMDRNILKEPILDIGCGEHGYLVEYLREQGLEAYGMDRSQIHRGYFIKGNWLEFKYGNHKWGTIISNLSFTSHFLHHFLQHDGLDISYAKVYMEILKSLIPGGTWIYAPSIPYMENLLPNHEYLVSRSLIDTGFYKTVIRRL